MLTPTPEPPHQLATHAIPRPPELDALLAAEVELTFRLRHDAALRPYLGSVLRGALKQALHDLVCTSPGRPCSTCLLAPRCAYSYLFETPVPPAAARLRKLQHLPHPLVLRPPELRDRPWHGEDLLRVGLILIGAGCAHLPYLIAAAEYLRLSSKEGPAAELRLERVVDHTPGADGRLLWARGEERVVGLRPAPADVWPPELSDGPKGDPDAPLSLRIELHTPAHILQQGRVTTDLSFRSFASALLRRTSSLLYFHCGQELDVDFRGLLDQAATVQRRASTLRRVQLAFHSRRQRRDVPAEGVVGSCTWEGEGIRALLPFVRVGSVVHVGKKTLVGFGGFGVG